MSGGGCAAGGSERGRLELREPLCERAAFAGSVGPVEVVVSKVAAVRLPCRALKMVVGWSDSASARRSPGDGGGGGLALALGMVVATGGLGDFRLGGLGDLAVGDLPMGAACLLGAGAFVRCVAVWVLVGVCEA